MGEIVVEHVARIEGHGNIYVRADSGQVSEVRFDVVEPARFFESMVGGKRFDQVSLITSRICGICSPNHAVTSLKAIEAAMGISVSERTDLLRKLLVYGSFLQNHATHLYMFAAPDYVGQPSVFPLAETHPEVVECALRIKKLGNELCTVVGGRPVHPVTAVVGGFTSEPTVSELEAIHERLMGCVQDAVSTVALFDGFEHPDFETKGDMVALADPVEYAIYDGSIASLRAGKRVPVERYSEVIVEDVVLHTNAKHSTIDGGTYMVGALSRINLSADLLMPRAKAVLTDLGIRTPSFNPFHNNVCQAIELVDAAERCASWVERLLQMGGDSMPVAFDVQAGSGTAATEAPRGVVFHAYSVDEAGVVVSADIITPTAQNVANLEADMRRFAPTVANLPQEDFALMLEKLVRAYDPCLSCSVH